MNEQMQRFTPAGDAFGYLPIRDYAAIGDCHGCALVSRSGSIDWAVFGRFDADPTFCRILDKSKGGFLSVRPREPYAVERAYLDNTNILRTVFATAEGRVALIDYMPVGRRPGAWTHDYVSLSAPGFLIRTIEGLAGRVTLDVVFRPSVQFARTPAHLTAIPGGVRAEGGPALHAGLDFSITGDRAEVTLEVITGERRHLVVMADGSLPSVSEKAIERLFEITQAFWSEWIAYCRYVGPYGDAVRRSALVLKLLTYAPTGAIVAAPTTSLPEQVGGERNWDYRYCWLRDASFTLYALAALGYSGEARSFGRFVRFVCDRHPADIQIMYGVDGEAELKEQVLEHLEGYRGSRPVCVGNAAYKQRQIDIYGELLDWVYLVATLGGRFEDGDKKIFERMLRYVADNWEEPDQGLWEMRSEPRHHVYGKMMCWVALDRGIRLLGPRPQWIDLRDRIRDAIFERGMDSRHEHLVQSYGRPEMDAALLLAPMLAFPVDRGVLERTVDAVERELRHGDYLKRYETDDGVVGDEGAFLICSFWLVDAYLALGRYEEARKLFEQLVACMNDVGLCAEEIDTETHAFLGNFPQAFTHLALIGNAHHLALYERGGAAAITGSHADRARRAVGATFGWRAIWEACKASGRLGRFWSSRRSILPVGLVPRPDSSRRP